VLVARNLFRRALRNDAAAGRSALGPEIDHVVRCADHIIDLGPEGGAAGGRVVASGTPEEVAANPKSATGQFLQAIL